MNRRSFLKSTFLATAGTLPLVSCTSLSGSTKQPNIVLILADDLGFADVGYHGCKDVATPHIDSIAKNGAWFSNGYASAPICGPSRCGLMTGRYQQRFGCEGNIGPHRRSPETKMGLPLEETTMATRLKKLGYSTACFGKWHLGGELLWDSDLFPLNRGFDEFYGFLEGAARYEDDKNVEKKYMRGNDLIKKNETEYYTDALGRESISFIKRNKDKPFFLYLPFNAVHAPMQASKECLERVDKSIKDNDRKLLAAMLISMDDNIGKIMQTLHDLKLEENTLVVFYSDNGGAPRNNFSLNTPLRGTKGELYEGGIKIPFCMQWKGKIPANKKYDHPIIAQDVLPTVIAAAGSKTDKSWKLDGVNLLPYIKGEKDDAPHETLYWKISGNYAIRHNNWKMVKEKRSKEPELFNLGIDPNETRNVAQKRPEIFKKLTKLYNEWDAQTTPPNFGWDTDIGERVHRIER